MPTNSTKSQGKLQLWTPIFPEFHYLTFWFGKRIKIENWCRFASLLNSRSIHFPSSSLLVFSDFLWVVFVFLAKQVRVSACAKGHLVALGPRQQQKSRGARRRKSRLKLFLLCAYVNGHIYKDLSRGTQHTLSHHIISPLSAQPSLCQEQFKHFSFLRQLRAYHFT